jgi:hypothetical protein
MNPVQAAFYTVSDIVVKVAIVMAVLSLLPESPFITYVSYFRNLPYLHYVAWFLPISDIILFMQIYLGMLASYYSILLGLRYANLIKGG